MRAARLFGDILGKGDVLAVGFVISLHAPLRMTLFGHHEGPQQTKGQSVKWVPIVVCS